MENKSTFSLFELLQPNLLSSEELINILTTRYVSRNIKDCSKEELVELYKRVALPLPQRTYTDLTHREKRLSNKQIKRKISIFTPSSSGYRTIQCSSKRLRLDSDNSDKPSGSKGEPNSSRMKPPIDLVNFKRKIIKLNTSSPTRRKSEDLDKIVIVDKKKENKCLTKDNSSDNDLEKKSIKRSHPTGNEIEKSIKKTEISAELEISKNEQNINGGKHKRITIDFSDASEKSTPTPKVVKKQNKRTKKHKRVVI